jgi:hypothetical protein
MAEVATINARVFLCKREMLKGLRRDSQVDKMKDETIFGEFHYCFLIHSQSNVGKDFKEIQRVNRENYLQYTVCMFPKITSSTIR